MEKGQEDVEKSIYVLLHAFIVKRWQLEINTIFTFVPTFQCIAVINSFGVCLKYK